MLEQLQLTMKVLAAKLPRFFGPPFDHARWTREGTGSALVRNAHRPKGGLPTTRANSSVAAAAALHRWAHDERRLYEHVRERLACVAEACERAAAGHGGSTPLAGETSGELKRASTTLISGETSGAAGDSVGGIGSARGDHGTRQPKRPVSRAHVVQRCLRVGRWVEQTPSSQRNATADWRWTWQTSWEKWAIARHPQQRKGPQRTPGLTLHCMAEQQAAQGPPLRWHGLEGECAEAVHDPLTGDFGGVFNDPERPVTIFVLADSVGAQLENALRVVAATNPHLRGLRFARWSDELYPVKVELSVIPSTTAGNLELLHGIRWDAPKTSKRAHPSAPPAVSTPPPPGDQAARGVHVVLANAGLHYNVNTICGAHRLLPEPSLRTCNLATHLVQNVDPRYHTLMLCNCGPSAFVLNESHPSRTRLEFHQSHWKTYMEVEGYYYDKGRKAFLLDGIEQYDADVSALAQAATQWLSEETVSKTVPKTSTSGTLRSDGEAGRQPPLPARRGFMWMESTPQHFFAPGHRQPARVSDTNDTADTFARARDEIAQCSESVGSLWPSNETSLTGAARAMCGLTATDSLASTDEAGGAAGAAGAAGALQLGSLPSANASACRQRAWRDEIASPRMEAAGITVVPLAVALSMRSRDHLGKNGDCSHWCPGSDATLFMAQSALSTLRAEVEVLLQFE